MLNKLRRILTAGSVAMAIWATPLFAETELRMTWYNDGIEGEVMRSLLDRFEAQNSDIKVNLDVVPYKSIMELCQYSLLLEMDLISPVSLILVVSQNTTWISDRI